MIDMNRSRKTSTKNPVKLIIKHLALLQRAHENETAMDTPGAFVSMRDFEVEADTPLCALIEHLEDDGWVPSKKQVLDEARKAKITHLDFTYLRTISKFKTW